MSCPQRPRTKKEDIVFYSCMDHMNEVYLYADMIVHIDHELPRPPVNEPVQKVTISNIQDYMFGKFIDVVQVWQAPSNSKIKVNDIILKVSGKPVKDVSDILKYEGPIEIDFLRRPYGRLNTTPADERGWLFLEQFTSALKVAASGEDTIDKIIISNNPTLRNKMYFMAVMLIRAMKKCDSTNSKDPIKETLNDFRLRLDTKRFSVCIFFSSHSTHIFTHTHTHTNVQVPTDSEVVFKLMKKLIETYEDEWKTQRGNQKSMLKRTRELNLEWGHFSSKYESRTGMKKSFSYTEIGYAWLRIVSLLLVPTIGILFLSFVPFPEITHHANFDTSLVHVIFCAGMVLVSFSTFPIIVNHELAEIPFGWHNVSMIIFLTCTVLFLSSILYLFVTSIFEVGVFVPWFCFFVGCLSSVLVEYLVSIKFIPAKDFRTQQNVKLTIAHYIHFPYKLRFDGLKKRAVRRNLNVLFLVQASCAVYVFLALLFIRVSPIVQACIIPFYFLTRVGFEKIAGMSLLSCYKRENTSHSLSLSLSLPLLQRTHTHTHNTERQILPVLGSDAIPLVTFFILTFHETCLVVMLSTTNMYIVGALVLLDVLENMFCLISLARVMKKKRIASVSIVIPDDSPQPGVQRKRARSTKKLFLSTKTRKLSSMNIYGMVSDLRDVSALKSRRVSRFIIATILQREFVEILVPLQSLLCFALLRYGPNKKFFTLTNDIDFGDAAQHLLLDTGVEIFMFILTCCVQVYLDPRDPGFRILAGIQKLHFVSMLTIIFVSWITTVCYMNVYSGFDISFGLLWIQDRCENSTWLGGFEWGTEFENGTVVSC